VTFLAAWDEGPDSIVLAADAREMHPHPKWGYWVWADAVDKFAQLDTEHGTLACGWRGTTDKWDMLSATLHAADYADWDRLLTGIQPLVAKLNEHTEPNEPDDLGLVLAGWLSGEKRILSLGHDGKQLNAAGSAYFQGPGVHDVAEAWWPLNMRSLTGFRSILDAHFETVVFLSEPARLWRLTRDGLTALP
jgi:hypothetical protein